MNPLLLKLAIPALTATLAIAGAYAFPLVGFKAQIDRVEASRDEWRGSAEDWTKAADGWERSFRLAEKRRGEEADQAVRAVQEVGLACDARVTAARRSATAIRAIVERPGAVDGVGCPVRGVVGAGDLRAAISP